MQDLIKVDKEAATKVLSEIDSLLQGVKSSIEQADKGFIALAFLLVEAKRGAYWTIRGFKTEHEYIQASFPQSRSQYYALIKIGRDLYGCDRQLLESLGRSKCEDLSRLHRSSGTVSKKWIDLAKEDDKDTFRRRVRDHFNKESPTVGQEQGVKTEDHFLKFRIFGDGIHTVNTALETAAKIAGTDKSTGYVLELICANFLSQYTDDGEGHVTGKNSLILSTIQGLVSQLDLSNQETGERLIGIVAAGVNKNTGTE
jgi:hypothetical protein